MSYNYDAELAPIVGNLELGSIEDPQAARDGMEEMVGLLNDGLNTTGVIIQDSSIAGPDGAPDIPIRIYKPDVVQGKSPGILHIHGGGFVVGSLDTEKGTCVSLVQELGVVVVSVGYRLAPENPYPAGLEDCYCALQWMIDSAAELVMDADRVAVFGQSAGGGLAAALALLCRDRQGPAICFQYLGIPEVDDRLHTRSMNTFTDTPMWNKPNAELSWKFYLGDDYTPGADNVPEFAAPARALDLTGLPPAHVTTMEFDPLRDEGILYAMHLLQAGVSVELHNYPGTFHGSSLVADAAISKQERNDMLNTLRRALNIKY